MHYINYGRSEGRAAHAITYRPNKLSVFVKGGNENYYFDADGYAAGYPDLYAACGKSKSALWNHYKTIGIIEGRTAYGTTDEINARLRVFDAASSITNDSMSDRAKVQAVHDWIVNNTVYDYQNYLNTTIPGNSYEIEGVMLKGVGVCSRYVKTFDYFMHVLGIGHEYVTGVASSDSGSGIMHNRMYTRYYTLLAVLMLYIVQYIYSGFLIDNYEQPQKKGDSENYEKI